MTKIFISHASEDKRDIVYPLAEKLKEHYDVWLDEESMVLGDSIPKEIALGINKSRVGLVILSKNFFSKKWTQAELSALLMGENSSKIKIIPVWHGVNYEDVYNFSPLLASKLAISTAEGIDCLVRKIIESISGKILKDSVMSSL